ncbi:hypothetical protein F5B22DRAFT_611459 [Xylaria bambusicola]|uniref:uncharacterized protein n=1 Tax=Xylaria bambusicola TaxID=326684 RepID=UPI0020078355|nr:uncharacterized protein F5B22DRAFT_611459 [Xylaria bambusicola]KAI0514402.1 hypothetical protein F5B22DRAFT_611459 [Xylaria bambusicola]
MFVSVLSCVCLVYSGSFVLAILQSYTSKTYTCKYSLTNLPNLSMGVSIIRRVTLTSYSPLNIPFWFFLVPRQPESNDTPPHQSISCGPKFSIH